MLHPRHQQPARSVRVHGMPTCAREANVEVGFNDTVLIGISAPTAPTGGLMGPITINH